MNSSRVALIDAIITRDEIKLNKQSKTLHKLSHMYLLETKEKTKKTNRHPKSKLIVID